MARPFTRVSQSQSIGLFDQDACVWETAMYERPPSAMALVVVLALFGCAARPTVHNAQGATSVRGSGPGLGVGLSCGGIAGLQCQSGLYCQYTPRSCHFDDAEGSCTPKPKICAQTSETICGCDGKTYQNTCIAAEHGVSPVSEGTCPNKTHWSWF